MSVVVIAAARTGVVDDYNNHKWKKNKKEILMKFSECVLQYKET
jgi:hypothetical protein